MRADKKSRVKTEHLHTFKLYDGFGRFSKYYFQQLEES